MLGVLQMQVPYSPTYYRQEREPSASLRSALAPSLVLH